MTDDNPRAVPGSNYPPLEPAETLPKRLELEHAELLDAASALELARFTLPEKIDTDEDCAAVSDFVAKVKKAANSAETTRKEVGKPYLEAQRTVKEWFDEIYADLQKQAETLTKAVGIYNKSKAERERAERIAREQEERRKADEARRQEQQRLAEAAAAQRRSEEAAQRVRQAEDAAAREQAAKEMREADTEAEMLREQAEAVGETAAKAERKADNHERAAAGPTTNLSRIAGAGATSSVTDKWTYTINDWDKLKASCGPLANWLNMKEIEAAVARAVRESSAGGATPNLSFPGVEIHTELKTNIRAARG